MTHEPIEIGGLPFYDADVESQGDPPAVAEFKAALFRADGLLIATPEHNAGLPGVLTNAIDWASRLPGRSPLAGKPVAVMGASPSQLGTARAQLHLRQVLAHTHARVLPPPSCWWHPPTSGSTPSCASSTTRRAGCWAIC